MDTSELIKEAKQGSAAAQKYLFDLMADKLLMICRRYVKNPEDAEEIMLDGFYKFFKNVSSFNYQSDAALFAWVKKIMINECLMFLRKKNVFTIVTDSVAEDIPLEEEALNNLSAAEIFNLIVQLPVGYRTVFNLYELEGMAHKEIAELLNISEGTSKSQLSKSKVLLQKMLLNKGIEYVKENHNNWKQKLEELDSLPGENLPDKNASWGKLHGRMGGKKQSKKTVWYWAAAACILFALMIPMMILNKKNHQVANVEIKLKPPEAKTSVALGIDKKDSVMNTNSVLPEKREVIVAGKLNKIQNNIPENKVTEIRLYDTVNLKNLITETNKNSLQQVDTSSNLTSIIPIRKKLRVVQINELGDPQESQPGLARNSDTHMFQFKFGNQEIFTNPSLVSSDKGFTILKIKTSPN